MKHKNRLLGLVYALILLGFTAYVLLDTFSIARVYQKVEPTAEPATVQPMDPVITDSSYQDDHIQINLTEQRIHDTAVYIANIWVDDPSYLKTALAQDSYGRNIKEKTSEMAQNHNAILAVNGDYYGAREQGYVLRNGILYRSEASQDREALVIGKDGSFKIIKEAQVSAEQLEQEGAAQVLSFGPALVTDGQVSVDEHSEVGQATYSNPRTAIAQVSENHYLMVVSDGRTSRSEGLSLYQLAHILKDFGARTAYNLDGGGSSTMWFNGQIINEPVNHGSKISERRVSDIVYIGY